MCSSSRADTLPRKNRETGLWGTDDDDIRTASIRHLDNFVRRIPKSRHFKNPIAGFRESLSCTVHEALSGGFYVGISNDMA